MTTRVKSAIVLGATGAVGGAVVRTLLDSPAWSGITILGRRPLTGLESHPDVGKIDPHIVDVADPASYEKFIPGHTVAFCTLGVGQPSKMSREEFRRIDFEYTLAFARACRHNGVRTFVLLTAIGSNPSSRIYYSKCKGELEEAVKALGFEHTLFAQPSMILTSHNRYGISQAIILKVWPWLNFLLSGPLRKYRGIRVHELGSSMVRAAENPTPGVRTLTWDDLRPRRRFLNRLPNVHRSSRTR